MVQNHPPSFRNGVIEYPCVFSVEYLIGPKTDPKFQASIALIDLLNQWILNLHVGW